MFDPRKKLFVLFNFSDLTITIQKQTANLYSHLLTRKDQNNLTQTLFVINQDKPTGIINDFSTLFLKEKTPNYVGEVTLDELNVTGEFLVFFILVLYWLFLLFYFFYFF
jgi:hypothetical protein